MLTALDGEEEQLRGYDLRIDDYITKPFSMPVLLRKIGAILRRCRGEDRPGANLLRYRDLTLDLDAYTVMRGDQMLELTNREFECPRELLQNQGRVMTYPNQDLLTNALDNVLMNAILYSPQGASIRIALDAHTLTIENTGVSIPEEALPQLFTPFYRVEQSRNRQSGGSGLGLYLVRLILELHNASCEIKDSEDGVVFSARFT